MKAEFFKPECPEVKSIFFVRIKQTPIVGTLKDLDCQKWKLKLNTRDTNAALN